MILRRCLLPLLLAACLTGSAAGQLSPDRIAALDRIERGNAAFRDGDMIAATQAWSEAIRLSQLLQAPDLEAQSLARRGEAYRTQGYFRHAATDLQAALDKAEASGNPKLIAAVSGALGNLELATKHSDRAEVLLLRSHTLAEQAGDGRLLASADNDLGNLYAETDRPELAAGAYTQALARSEASGDDVFAGTVAVNSARLALRRNDPGSAAVLLARAMEHLGRTPPSYNAGIALVSVGSAVLERDGDLPAEQNRLAERAFRAAASTADALHNMVLSSLARGGLGRLYERTGRNSDALRLTEQAAFAAQKAPAPEMSYKWAWQQARLARQRGRSENALTSYRRAVAELQSVRQDIPVQYREGRSSYPTTFGPLYLEFSDLLLRKAAADPSRAAALIREARDTIELLKESELQDYFRDSCVASFAPRRRALESVAPGTAVLYPISFGDRLELLVSFSDEQRQFTLPLPEAKLRREVQQFRQLLEKRTTNEYLVPARQLYDQLIRPIEPLLAQQRIDTLVIVPNEVLRVVPFAALHDGRGFLIDRYATAIAPSLHLTDPKSLAAAPGVALVLGLAKSVQGFTELPNVSREVAEVHAIAGGKELLNEQFTDAHFASELKTVPYNVVHIASHGQFNSDPKQTFLLAYDGTINMDRLEAEIKYGERREKALELLVLSACETATGDDRAALGLAGVALKAGARSALAGLWYISDEATGALVVNFYRGLQSGASKSRALQSAQRSLVASYRYSHPAYWAPFLLIGNWL